MHRNRLRMGCCCLRTGLSFLRRDYPRSPSTDWPPWCSGRRHERVGGVMGGGRDGGALGQSSSMYGSRSANELADKVGRITKITRGAYSMKMFPFFRRMLGKNIFDRIGNHALCCGCCRTTIRRLPALLYGSSILHGFCRAAHIVILAPRRMVTILLPIPRTMAYLVVTHSVNVTNILVILLVLVGTLIIACVLVRWACTSTRNKCGCRGQRI